MQKKKTGHDLNQHKPKQFYSSLRFHHITVFPINPKSIFISVFIKQRFTMCLKCHPRSKQLML